MQQTTALAWTNAQDLATAIRTGNLTAVEVAEDVIARVEAYDRGPNGINSFTSFDPERIRAEAAAIQSRLDAGEAVGAIAGVPFALKELTTVVGEPETAGLVPLKDMVGTRNAAIYERLTGAGGIYIGKTNTPEAGYYGGTENHLHGATHNPWKPGHSAGGSSGGSAAAVAAGLVPLAEGSDGAGSVRIPASLSGVVGLKPSLGRIPCTVMPTRYNTWAFHGPIARTVGDATLMLQIMAGPSPEDPLSLPDDGTDYLAEIAKDIKGLRIAYSPDLGTGNAVDPEVAAICKEAVKAFEELGATVVEATPAWGLPEDAMWHSIWVPGFAPEHDLIDWEANADVIDPELIDLIKQSETLTSQQIGTADMFRARMWDTFATFMKDYDVLISPTLAEATYPHGQFAPSRLLGKSLQEQLLAWLLTYPYNMLTTPAVTVPAGFTSDGRPVGLQIGGGHLADALVMRVAANFEKARPWAEKTPDLAPFASAE